MVICFAEGNYINTRATVETAVAPRTAYPEAYAPLRVRTRVQQVRRPCRGYAVGTPRLTFAHVPTQVTETVEGVESERGGEDEGGRGQWKGGGGRLGLGKKRVPSCFYFFLVFVFLA